jgi:hypothetical protein
MNIVRKKARRSILTMNWVGLMGLDPAVFYRRESERFLFVAGER